MLNRIALSAFLAVILSGCASLMLDFSRFDGSDKLHEHIEVRSVDASFKEPKRLSVFASAMERVDLKKNPGTETCEGFANWLPNEMIRVTTKMDLRLFAFGQFGKGLVVKHPSGKIDCGAFAQGNDPAEIMIKDAMPGIYQVRISSPNVNPRLSDYDNNKRDPENENRIYRGDFMQIFAEDVTDRNPTIFNQADLKNLHLRIHENGRMAANSDWDQAVERGRVLLAEDAKQRSQFFSDVLSVSAQTLQVVVEEQQAQALAAQAAQQQLSYSQMQQQSGSALSATRPTAQSSNSQTPTAVGSTVVRNQTAQAGQGQPVRPSASSAPTKVSYPAIVLEFPNADGWKRGDSSGTDTAGDLSVSIEARPVATKGKMSVMTTFCNTGDTVWKGGVRVSPNPPTRSHASKQVPPGGCSKQEETFSEGASVIYVYIKRAE